ncbi:hypothetical protein AERO9AM_30398 [Aeromicrobium sp. 9AM]|nr:hypothetical protein AERO9AM_30398 [Aeromicrobium sp. 9AM]
MGVPADACACRVGGMVDATVSKTVVRKGVRVRVPHPAPGLNPKEEWARDPSLEATTAARGRRGAGLPARVAQPSP